MSPEAIEQLVRAYFTHMGTMTPQGWLDIFAEDAVIYDPVGNPPNKVHQDSEKFFAMLSQIFQQLEVTADKIFVAGNGAAVQWTMRGVANNGKLGTTQGISVFDINNAEKIQQVSSYWSETDMMNQLK